MTHDTFVHVHNPEPPARPSNLGKKLRRWTYSEITRLYRLCEAGKTRAEMAVELEMSEERIRQRLQLEDQSSVLGAARKKRRMAQRLATKAEQKTPRLYRDLVIAGPKPTEQALTDRALRFAAAPRDFTAAFCGDPLPGYSALERRL